MTRDAWARLFSIGKTGFDGPPASRRREPGGRDGRQIGTTKNGASRACPQKPRSPLDFTKGWSTRRRLPVLPRIHLRPGPMARAVLLTTTIAILPAATPALAQDAMRPGEAYVTRFSG